MEVNLNIPEKIKVGFQNRQGTYTGKLAYIIYFDKKGVLRKEQSWQGWRDKKIEPEEFQNIPTEGFVLNKKVGGYKSDWNFRNAYCRIWDPRGFEFEISFENLLFILQECTSTKGKGLEGEFVYAWNGKDLVLLPISCENYKQSKTLIEKTEKISSRNLKVGASYKSTKYDNLVYLGRYDWNIFVETSEYKDYLKNRRYDYRSGYEKFKGQQYKLQNSKQHIFYNQENKSWNAPFIALKSMNNLQFL